MRALVLSGGGARGAYQAGVLTAVSEVCAESKLSDPFQIYSGVSAGAINAGFLAAKADEFIKGADDLAKLWSGLTTDSIFHSDPISLGKIGLKWMRDLPTGGLTGMSAGPSLLNTSPLRDTILSNLDFPGIQTQIQKKSLHALAITAVDYHSAMAVTFVQGQPETNSWVRSRRFSEKAIINADHIMGSSAIPLLFPPVKVSERYYGDGCVRNMAPLSPSIHMGANKILVVGVRRQTNVQEGYKPEPTQEPTMARVFNVLLNAVLLDGIELDVDRLNRINDFMSKLPKEVSQSKDLNFKKVECLWIYPSRDIGHLAYENVRKLPKFIRYLLRGLGPTEDAKEIISYLLFEPDFTSQLIEMGYSDGMKQKDAIQQLLTT